MVITIIAGARPNFIKIAPIIQAIIRAQDSRLRYNLVHTGQHFDKKMSQSFFEELHIPPPDVNLECGGGTQAEQTANIMVRFEKYLSTNPCDLVLVVGDVTSTMACSIVAKKLNTKVAHVEAGIRSGDMNMPEEVNRIVTDALSDFYFTTSELANANLIKSGVEAAKIFFVGNTMIDTLLTHQNNLREPILWKANNLAAKEFFVLTLHRPSNVDDVETLRTIIDNLINSSKEHRIIFPVHPRTAKSLALISFDKKKLILAEPLSYLEFMYLVSKAKAVITDSGGITEETTVLKIPCLTLRNSTERPETITIGTNELIGTDPANIKPAIKKVLENNWKKGEIPALWDGKTSERIIKILSSFA